MFSELRLPGKMRVSMMISKRRNYGQLLELWGVDKMEVHPAQPISGSSRGMKLSGTGLSQGARIRSGSAWPTTPIMQLHDESVVCSTLHPLQFG